MRKKNRRVFVYLIFGVGFLATALHLFFSDRALENAAAYVMYPILLAQNKIVVPIKTYFEKKHTLQEFEHLVKELQSERDQLVADNIELRSVLSYTDQTNDLIEFKNQYQMKDAKLTQILVKHFSDQSHYFLIDKGLNAGISQDMVAVYKNCLLGKVVEVYPQYSKVLLVTDKKCKVAAFCSQTRASGIHQGANREQQTSLNFVSHLNRIDPNDLVLSSGDGLIFPKGFALGRIKSCINQGLLYEIMIEPLLDFRKMMYCFIVQKGGSNTIDHTVAQKVEEHILAQVESEIVVDPTQLAHKQKQEQLELERVAMLQRE